LPREVGDALPLTAGFDVVGATGAAPHVVRFSPDVSGAVLSYRWDFGDGESFVSDMVAPLPDIAYQYDHPGIYSVMLTVSGPGGQRTLYRGAAVQVTDDPPIDDCPCTIWGSSVPRVADSGASEPINVGMRFVAVRPAVVTGIRFYKSPANVGPHVGQLWSDSGQLLASVAFTGGPASGWQQANFQIPVSLGVGAAYVVSYHAPAGHVARDDGVFLKSLGGGLLAVPASRAAAPNGVFAFGPASTFPSRGRKQTHYAVDVVVTTDLTSALDGHGTLPTRSSAGGEAAAAAR
jgi:PKD repeat protein